MEFTKEEKILFFEKIYELYFCQNFGSVSKSDLDVLFFSEYIEHCIKNNEPFDDYNLSKKLGLTQSRIRNLKEKKELKYPHKGFDWKTSFAEAIKNAKYIEKDHSVKILIQDINVIIEVRHYIEEKGWFDECSLNKKLVNIPLECFIEIFVDNDLFNKISSKDIQKELQKIKDYDNKIKPYFTEFTKESLQNFLMSASKEIIISVIRLLPFGGLAGTVFKYLGKIIQGV